MSYELDDQLTPALKQYLDIKKNLDPAQEVRRRAKNIGMRLIRMYSKVAPSVSDIISKFDSLHYRIKVRASIASKTGKKGRKLARKIQLMKELRARINARMFTATGWFGPVERLGGKPRKENKKIRGIAPGFLLENLSGMNPSEELVNLYSGAAQDDARAGGGVKKACDEEADDIKVYLDKKNEEAAQKAGLKH